MTALALPALALVDKAKACSVPPTGRYEPEQAYGSCDPDLIENWPDGLLQQTNAYGSWYTYGQLQVPAHTVLATDTVMRAQLTGGQYADFTELLTWAGGGAAAGELSRVGNHGYAFRNGYGVGVAVAFWIGWNAGTFIHLNGPAVDSWLRDSSAAAFIRSYGSAMGSILSSGGGGSLLVVRLR